GELPILVLNFVEQSRVLDSDRSLVSECFQKINLVCGKQACTRTSDGNRSYRHAVPQNRHSDGTAIASDHGQGTQRILGVGLNVRNLRHIPIKDGSCRCSRPTWNRRINASVHHDEIWSETVMCYEMNEVSVKFIYEAKLCVAEPRCTFRNHVEHWLDSVW